MPRVLIINDIHYTRNPPRSRGDDYHRRILAKLRWIGKFAAKAKAGAIVCTGDWFHRKGKVTFRESNDILAILNEWRDAGLTVASILGNHDIAGHSIDSMDTRAVGTFVHSGAMHLLDHGPVVLEDDAGTLTITGTSYFHGCDRDDANRIKMYGSDVDGLNLHISHGTLMVKGEFFGEFTKANDLIALLDQEGKAPDILACGHLHFDEGIVEFSHGESKTTICRVGSVSRVSSNDFDRSPRVVLIATRGSGFVCRGVPIHDVEKIEIESPDEPECETNRDIGEFIESLKIQSDSTSVSDLPGVVRDIGVKAGFSEDGISIAADLVRGEQ